MYSALQRSTALKIICRISQQVFHRRPVSIQPLRGSFYNSVYHVYFEDLDVVIKVVEGVHSYSSVAMEFARLQQVHKAGIASPEPLLFGSLDGATCSFLIMSFVNGASLHQTWRTLSNSEKRSIQAQMAEMLNALSQIAVFHFGLLTQNPVVDFRDFRSFLNFQRSCFLASAVSNELPICLRNDLQELDSFVINVTTGISPIFTHGDFRLRNLMIDNNKLVLLDFDKTIGMLPGFDIYYFFRLDTSQLDLFDVPDLKLMIEHFYAQHRANFILNKLLCGLRLATFFYSISDQRAETYLNDVVQGLEAISDFR